MCTIHDRQTDGQARRKTMDDPKTRKPQNRIDFKKGLQQETPKKWEFSDPQSPPLLRDFGNFDLCRAPRTPVGKFKRGLTRGLKPQIFWENRWEILEGKSGLFRADWGLSRPIRAFSGRSGVSIRNVSAAMPAISRPKKLTFVLLILFSRNLQKSAKIRENLRKRLGLSPQVRPLKRILMVGGGTASKLVFAFDRLRAWPVKPCA